MAKPKKQKKLIKTDADLPLEDLDAEEARSITLKTGEVFTWDESCALLKRFQLAARKAEKDPGFLGKEEGDEELLEFDWIAMTLWAVCYDSMKAQDALRTASELFDQVPLRNFKQMASDMGELMGLLNPNDDGAESTQQSSEEP